MSYNVSDFDGNKLPTTAAAPSIIFSDSTTSISPRILQLSVAQIQKHSQTKNKILFTLIFTYQ
jgi:hypothetical protein